MLKRLEEKTTEKPVGLWDWGLTPREGATGWMPPFSVGGITKKKIKIPN